MNAWKVVCATLVIFIAGIVTGVVLVRLGEREPRPWLRPQRAPQVQPGPGPIQPRPGPNENRPPGNNGGPGSGAARDREFVQLLESQIQITPEQRAEIIKILAAGQERIQALRQGLEPEIRREMQKSREQIQALLTDSQRELFQRLVPQRGLRRADSTNQPPPERRLRDLRENRRGPPPESPPESAPPAPALEPLP